MRNTPKWARMGWKKPGAKVANGGSFVRAVLAANLKPESRQVGQWVETRDGRNWTNPLRNNSRGTEDRDGLSRVLFKSEEGQVIPLHETAETRRKLGTVNSRVARSHKAKREGRILHREPQQVRMVIEKRPALFNLSALRRIANIIEGRIRALEKKSEAK